MVIQVSFIARLGKWIVLNSESSERLLNRSSDAPLYFEHVKVDSTQWSAVRGADIGRHVKICCAGFHSSTMQIRATSRASEDWRISVRAQRKFPGSGIRGRPNSSWRGRHVDHHAQFHAEVRPINSHEMDNSQFFRPKSLARQSFRLAEDAVVEPIHGDTPLKPDGKRVHVWHLD